MSNMSLKEALAAVLKDMEAMSTDELRANLQEHSNGMFATAMREAREFLASLNYFGRYHIFSSRLEAEAYEDLDFASLWLSMNNFECIATAVNDNSYALAA